MQWSCLVEKVLLSSFVFFFFVLYVSGNCVWVEANLRRTHSRRKKKIKHANNFDVKSRRQSSTVSLPLKVWPCNFNLRMPVRLKSTSWKTIRTAFTIKPLAARMKSIHCEWESFRNSRRKTEKNTHKKREVRRKWRVFRFDYFLILFVASRTSAWCPSAIRTCVSIDWSRLNIVQ